MEYVTESAPAKLNLFLHVTGKRADGYHLLESLAAFTAFGDTLELYPSDALSLDIVGPFAGALRHAAQQNLIMKAATALRTHTGCTRGARMVLHKRIPVSAGLGGGSSDAAAALRGLAVLWKLSVTQELMQALALSLGSDVPACIAARPAIMCGIGDKLIPLEWDVPAWAVLVNPYLPLATPDVFRHFSAPFDAPLEIPARIGSFDALMELLSGTRNALETPAIRLQPMVAEILDILAPLPHCRMARMSGSGATCFGLFESAPAADAAVRRLQQSHPGWWAMAAAIR